MTGIQRAPWLSYRGMFARQTVKHLCQMMFKIPGFCKFLFLSSVIKFDNKMSEVKTKITIAQLLSLTICLCKVKIYSPRRVRRYLSPGNSIILEIAATVLFIGVTNFHWFWGSFCWNSSTLPTGLWTLPAYRAILKNFSPITFQP